MSRGQLHPELLRIRQEYEDLYEAVSAGHVDEDEARDLLRNITAVDGDGAVWSFDPHTGNLVRAVPGLPSQQASPEMFTAPHTGPRNLLQDPSQDPPMPSLSGGYEALEEQVHGGWEDEGQSPPRRLGQGGGGRRSGGRESREGGGFRLDPRLVRPLVVGVLVVAVSAFFLFSGGGEEASPGPVPSPAPAPAPSPEVPSAPDAPVPPTPVVLSPLPQVVFGPSGEPERLDRAAVERLFEGVLSAEVEVFSAAPGSWTRVYALPLLGASASGWRVSVAEWAVAPDGRDRITLVLTHPEFPSELRWWAFVEPENGVWVFSELRPLPAS